MLPAEWIKITEVGNKFCLLATQNLKKEHRFWPNHLYM